jgi:hypothetical protein
MRRCSEDYSIYDAISIILKFLKENMPNDFKREFYNEFVSPYINRDRGNDRRRYIYGKQFLGRNKKGGPSAVNEFFDFLIKNVDEYYLERCRRLYNALSPNKTKRLNMSLNSMLTEAQNTYFINIAEEELLTDL